MVDLIKLGENNILFPKYRGRLTEGITYNPSNNTLIWVDIIEAEVHRVYLSDEDYQKNHQVLKFKEQGESIGTIGLTIDDNIIIVCGKYGVAKGSFKTGEISYFLKYNHDDTQSKRLRSNDGIIDPWGHLWIGVMSDFHVTELEGNVSPEGRLYRVNCHDLTVDTMIEDCLISNGMSFANNGKQLYWTDSLTNSIWLYDYSYIANELSNKRKYVNAKEIDVLKGFKNPEPDGFVMTKSNEIYSAIFSTCKLLHFDGSGKCIEELNVPAERVTSATIGGKCNDELYITTGHRKLEDSSEIIDATDKSGDLGGFLFTYKLKSPVDVQSKHVWGAKLL